MCGRARLSTNVSEIKLRFSIPPVRPARNFVTSNMATLLWALAGQIAARE